MLVHKQSRYWKETTVYKPYKYFFHIGIELDSNTWPTRNSTRPYCVTTPQNSLTVEKLNDIGKVHGVGQDDVTVGLEQRQRYEQHHVLWGHVPRCPN